MDECCFFEFVQSVCLNSNAENGSNFKLRKMIYLLPLSIMYYVLWHYYIFENVFLYIINVIFKDVLLEGILICKYLTIIRDNEVSTRRRHWKKEAGRHI